LKEVSHVLRKHLRGEIHFMQIILEPAISRTDLLTKGKVLKTLLSSVCVHSEGLNSICRSPLFFNTLSQKISTHTKVCAFCVPLQWRMEIYGLQLIYFLLC
jgi:hypothetical protein